MRIRPGITNYYIYGSGFLYELTETSNTTNMLSYHYDFRGSTVALTDGGGNLTDRFASSSYGSLIQRSGTNYTPFLLNGRFGVQTDPNGLLYMRSRYYNPYICRFINPDPIGFSGGLNWYAFADGNPIRLIDPFGLWAGVDDLLFTGVGALIGVAGQGIVDLVKGKFSGLGAYGVAAVAGAAGGEATLYTGPVGGGLVAGFTQNLFKQGDKILSGQQQNYNFLDAAKDTAIGGVVGAVPVPRIRGINAGQGSLQAVERQIVTKLENGTIQSFTATTAGKIGINEIYTSLPGIGYEWVQAAFSTPPQNGQTWLTTPNTFQFGNNFNNINNSNSGKK
jgi:RHS repeat-associated protein